MAAGAVAAQTTTPTPVTRQSSFPVVGLAATETAQITVVNRAAASTSGTAAVFIAIGGPQGMGIPCRPGAQRAATLKVLSRRSPFEFPPGPRSPAPDYFALIFEKSNFPRYIGVETGGSFRVVSTG